MRFFQLLLAAALGVDLGFAAAQKFNEVSERVGFPDRIERDDFIALREQCAHYRIRATKAEMETAEWKSRFDLLLKNGAVDRLREAAK